MTATAEKISEYFGPMRKMGPGARCTSPFNGGRWYVSRGTGRTWNLLFRKDGLWHQFGKFATLTAAIAAYEAMEV